jgi:DNA-binding beta-propeller fold protein YncE
MSFGTGKYQYEVVDNWAKRPVKWPFVEVADVAVDKDDNVFVFNRSDHPIMIFDKDGDYLDWWGADHFVSISARGAGPHGITIAADNTVYLTDTGDHTIKQFTADGKLLMTLGTRFHNAPPFSGEPFNRPTHVAVSTTGELYVSDGYGNARVHVFSGDGKHLRSWGERGDQPGQFNLPHSIWIDNRDQVYVSDRANNRIQVFNLAGEFISQNTEVHHPNDLMIRNDIVYICELDHRMSLWDLEGNLQSIWGEDGESQEAGGLIAPHGSAVDSRGVIYIGDVAESYKGIDRGSRAVQKFVPIK